ncbi:hypothetical protein ACE6H2_001914 [Prunus campanulata]
MEMKLLRSGDLKVSASIEIAWSFCFALLTLGASVHQSNVMILYLKFLLINPITWSLIPSLIAFLFVIYFIFYTELDGIRFVNFEFQQAE